MGVVVEEEGMGVEDTVGMSLNRANRSWFAMYVEVSNWKSECG